MNIIKKIYNMSWGEILPLLKQAHRETKRSYCDLGKDLYSCYKKGYNWCEYFSYNFQNNREESYRTSFVSGGIHHKVITRLFGQSKEDNDFFEDKGLFNKNFKDLKGFASLDLRYDSFEAFEKFLKENKFFFIKTATGYGGHEVKRVHRSAYAKMNDRALYDHLKDTEYYIVEEVIKQHPEVSKLSVNSVNTLRVITVKDINGVITSPFVVSRISITEAYADNCCLGGAYCIVSKDGKIKHDYIAQLPELKLFSKNPITGFEFHDFQFPYFKESLKLCVEAAKRCKGHYIGWDVAITEKGPVLIEGNTAPGPDLYQAYNQLDNGRGRLKELEEAFKVELK